MQYHVIQKSDILVSNPESPQPGHTDYLDFVGIGFGPANLSVAVALAELDPGRTFKKQFFERNTSFQWHPGLLIESSRLQVSFLKDLVLQRNPGSPYTFINYLLTHGRLQDFICMGATNPMREDFSCYLQWVASFFRRETNYGAEVSSLLPVVSEDGQIRSVRVVVQVPNSPQTRSYEAGSLCIGAGGRKRFPIPDEQVSGRLMAHSSDFLFILKELKTWRRPLQRITVIGAGQSAAEVIRYLMDSFPQAEIISVQSGLTFRQSDSSPFINEVFNPGARDRFMTLTEPRRRHELTAVQVTNYSVVDSDLIASLYQENYRRKISGGKPLQVIGSKYVTGATAKGDSLELTLSDVVDGQLSKLDCDFAFFATGYDWQVPRFVEEHIGPFLRRDGSGRVLFDSGSRVSTDSRFEIPLYLLGYGEHINGISETLLSNIAFRSAEVARDLIESKARDSRLRGCPKSVARSHEGEERSSL